MSTEFPSQLDTLSTMSSRTMSLRSIFQRRCGVDKQNKYFITIELSTLMLKHSRVLCFHHALLSSIFDPLYLLCYPQTAFSLFVAKTKSIHIREARRRRRRNTCLYTFNRLLQLELSCVIWSFSSLEGILVMPSFKLAKLTLRIYQSKWFVSWWPMRPKPV